MPVHSRKIYNQERFISRRKKNEEIKNKLLHLEHIEIRETLKNKLGHENWNKLPVRVKSAKIFGFRLSRIKKGRADMKQLNIEQKAVYVWLFQRKANTTMY